MEHVPTRISARANLSESSPTTSITNSRMQQVELAELNLSLEQKSAQEVIAEAYRISDKVMTSTTFGHQSAAILHMVTTVNPEATILWIDTGYNTSATYRFADQLIERLNLNVEIYAPKMTSTRRNVLMGGIPEVDDPLHDEFTRQVKLEPFERATNKLSPEIWLTGVRREQTEFRQTLQFASRTNGGLLKFAPLLNWDEAQMEAYLLEHSLPNEQDYFDPTKATDARECGLQTRM
jgi:phosphoadenosine phosphosulfate reductase